MFKETLRMEYSGRMSLKDEKIRMLLVNRENTKQDVLLKEALRMKYSGRKSLKDEAQTWM